MHDGRGPGGIVPTHTVGAPDMPGMTGGGGRTGGITPYWANMYLIDAGVNKVHISLIWCKGGVGLSKV
jgi:hypothetical protein